MRILATCSAIAVLALGACASGSHETRETYADALQKLTEDCRARGGILAPLPNATQVRPETDYACRVNGGPSDRIG